jgi:3D (Asp-Asp-Asp) domain-containing protein
MRRTSRAARLSALIGIGAVLLIPGIAGAAGPPSGGAGLGGGGLAPVRPPQTKIPTPPSKRAHGSWIAGFTLTEYWPAPEAWFVGALVKAPGLRGRFPIDWLYSAMGISMQGEGLGLDGRLYHINAIGDGGWVTADGSPTSAGDGFSAGSPYWRAGGYWRNRSGAVTFPLQGGGWSSGHGRRYLPLRDVSFAVGPSLPLKYYQSIAVDPGVIPLGSRVYIPAYRHDGYGGWFVAQDTGGAVGGDHIDVYRPPPASPTDAGRYFTGQRVFVVRPRR